jgi:hypothetical protein
MEKSTSSLEPARRGLPITELSWLTTSFASAGELVVPENVRPGL